MTVINRAVILRSGHLCVASPKQELVVMCRNELISPGTHQLLLLKKKYSDNRDLDSLQVMLVWWWLHNLAVAP